MIEAGKNWKRKNVRAAKRKGKRGDAENEGRRRRRHGGGGGSQWSGREGNEIKARADERGPMAGISPTIGSAQHPMIRRRLRLAEVRMSALDGLTLLPFPRLPCDTNSCRGCIADTGRGIWPSSDVSIERSFFFFIFFFIQ